MDNVNIERLCRLHKLLFDIRVSEEITDEECSTVWSLMNEIREGSGISAAAVVLVETANRLRCRRKGYADRRFKLPPLNLWEIKKIKWDVDYLAYMMSSVKLLPHASMPTDETRQLASIISRDDFDDLQQFYTTRSTVDDGFADRRWEIICYRDEEWDRDMTKSLTLLEMCAFMGAAKCFRYCITIGHTVDDMTFEWALLGGTTEIIRLCIDRLHNYQIEEAARRMAPEILRLGRNDLYDFLVLNYSISVYDQLEESLCAMSANIPMLIRILRERRKYVRPRETITNFSKVFNGDIFLEKLYSAEAILDNSGEIEEFGVTKDKKGALPMHRDPTWNPNVRWGTRKSIYRRGIPLGWRSD